MVMKPTTIPLDLGLESVSPDDGRRRYWLTPPDLYARLEREYGPFTYDPCPCPVPPDFNGLLVPWGRMNYVNPPFRQHDGVDGQGPTAFAHKAIDENRRYGRGALLTLPVQSYVMLLAAAGARIVSLGRVPWLDVDTGEPCPSPSPICGFYLPPKE